MPTPVAGEGPERGAPAPQAERWDRFVAEFVEAYLEANPTAAVHLGRHEFDGRLPDWSRAGLEGEVARLQRSRERALEFPPDGLDDRRAFERDYLLAVVDGEIFWLDAVGWPFRSPTHYAWPLDPTVYLMREYAPLEERMLGFIGWARAVPEAALRIRENLSGPMPRTYVEIGRTSFGGLASYLEGDAPRAFGAVCNEALHRQLREAVGGAVRALRELDEWFASREAEAGEAYALGPEMFARMLQATERVNVPLDELERAGREELERELAALQEACAAYAPGIPAARCISRMRAKKPEGGPVEGARRQLGTLRSFVLERDLVTIPDGGEARVAQSPPHMRWNAAYIDIPGPFEQGVPAVFYLAPPDPAWSAAERDAYLPGEADLLFVSAHEVWPGHYLHFLHANHSLNALGRVFVGYAFSEGWAHYTEEMMWEAGLGGGDAETRIGQLMNSLLRTVRLLVAIGLHTGTKTVPEAERMFREVAFQDAANARQQAARGTFDPAYLNYTLGKLLIRRMRQDWTAPRGGRTAWREFHDRLLSYGGPPLPLVRAAMLGDGGSSLL
ncbi:MAG: DUF885 domain-containing protein [Gemmatimonadota bacterium]